MSREWPVAPVIEIVERGAAPTSGPAVIVPQDVRINGVSLLCSDDPVVVHEISTTPTECVRVTVTFLARRVFIGFEDEAPPPVVLTKPTTQTP